MVHITESYGGGVAAAIRDYCRNYPSTEHHLIFAPRSDAPVDESHRALFSKVTELGPGHVRRISSIRSYLKDYPDAAVHAHSSFAGAYTRAAFRKTAERPIIYTPHCYGFERRDIGWGMRAAFWAAEWFFAFNTTAFAACSKREEELSKWPLVSAKRVVLQNVPAQDIQPRGEKSTATKNLLVVGAGRLGPQKDPEFFRDCIVALREAGHSIEPLWIGGGDPEIEDMLEESGIPTTGWLPRESALERLREADVYIHSARWEGFPIAVLEAAIVGVPMIVRDIPAFSGVQLPVVINSPSDLCQFWPGLESASARSSLVRAAADALASCNDTAQSDALQSLYAVASPAGS